MKRRSLGLLILILLTGVAHTRGARGTTPCDLWIACGPGAAFAQVPISGRVVGTIRNDAGVPLSGVPAMLSFKGHPGAAPPPTPVIPRAVSQRDGLFWIDQVEPGIYHLTVESPGGEGIYEGVSLEIEVLTATAKVVEIVIG